MKSKKKFKNTWRQMKMETQCSKSVGHNKSSSKRKVYSNINLRRQEKFHITNLNLPLEELAKE